MYRLAAAAAAVEFSLRVVQQGAAQAMLLLRVLT
jgi:hypothetical protein